MSYVGRSAEKEFFARQDYETCWNPHCFDSAVLDTGLCAKHALNVYTTMKSYAASQMIVKIGTTMHLSRRMRELGSHKYYKDRGMNYVGALEVGGRELEDQRHAEFWRERIDRTEDFVLSKKLAEHIVSLAPHRDNLFRRATGDGELQVVYYLTNGPIGQSI